MIRPVVNMYVDGSCMDTYGGWGCLMQSGYHKCLMSEGDKNTTNNRMELYAVIAGLSQLTCPCIVNIYSDSQYVVNAIKKKWLYNWIKNGWRNTSGVVPNQDLWIMLLPYLEIHEVHFNWVKGHNGHLENEICDQLAQSEARKMKLL